MRYLIAMLAVLAVCCAPAKKEKHMFHHLAGRDTVAVYLSKLGLDSVPPNIGDLQGVKSLTITRDSVVGWTVYPPVHALQQRAENPPFRYLPAEFAQLTSIKSLTLKALDLKELPANFGDLSELEYLNLSLNKLKISDEMEKLAKLKKLRKLIVVGNQLDSTDLELLKRHNPELMVETGLEQTL